MKNIETLVFPRFIGMRHAKNIVLDDSLFVEQWVVPKGAKIRIFQTQNFGWVILEPNQTDERGFVIPRRIFRW